MIERYKEMVTSSGGAVHRVEDWGRKKLAYPVNKLHKAHYVLLNIECNQETLANLQYSFRFNDVVLRFLVMAKKFAETEDSAMLIATREEKEQEEKSRDRFSAKERVAGRDGDFSGGKKSWEAKDTQKVTDTEPAQNPDTASGAKKKEAAAASTDTGTKEAGAETAKTRVVAKAKKTATAEKVTASAAADTAKEAQATTAEAKIDEANSAVAASEEATAAGTKDEISDTATTAGDSTKAAKEGDK